MSFQKVDLHDFSLVPDFLAEMTISTVQDLIVKQEKGSLLCPVRDVHEYLCRTRDCCLSFSCLLYDCHGIKRCHSPSYPVYLDLSCD